MDRMVVLPVDGKDITVELKATHRVFKHLDEMGIDVAELSVEHITDFDPVLYAMLKVPFAKAGCPMTFEQFLEWLDELVGSKYIALARQAGEVLTEDLGGSKPGER